MGVYHEHTDQERVEELNDNKPLAWRQFSKSFALELKQRVRQDLVFQGAAALAFFGMLSVFPGLIFLLSIAAYLPLGGLQAAVMEFLHSSIPEQAAVLLESTINRILGKHQPNLLSFGVIATVWAASSGMHAAMQQLNRAYSVKEHRRYVKARATSIVLTLAFGVLFLFAFLLIVLGGILQNWLLRNLGGGDALRLVFVAARWLLILVFLLGGLALVYYFGPNIEHKFSWISPGSMVAVVLLVLASLGFRLYVSNFGDYEATYGTLGTFIVLMLWFYVCGLVLLLGSEINVALETARNETSKAT